MADFDKLWAEGLRDLAAETPQLPQLSARARRRIRAGRALTVVAGVAVLAGICGGLVIGAQALSRVQPPAGTVHSATAYVLNTSSNTVTPIRTATSTALPPVKVGGTPCAIAVTPDGRTAYGASHGLAAGNAGTVTPIRTATSTALPPIRVGHAPCAIAITPNRSAR